jgi:hypothetical protein
VTPPLQVTADHNQVLQENSDHTINSHVCNMAVCSPPPPPTTGNCMQTTPMGFHETSDHTIMFYIMEAAWLTADHTNALQEITDHTIIFHIIYTRVPWLFTDPTTTYSRPHSFLTRNVYRLNHCSYCNCRLQSSLSRASDHTIVIHITYVFALPPICRPHHYTDSRPHSFLTRNVYSRPNHCSYCNCRLHYSLTRAAGYTITYYPLHVYATSLSADPPL